MKNYFQLKFINDVSKLSDIFLHVFNSRTGCYLIDVHFNNTNPLVLS